MLIHKPRLRALFETSVTDLQRAGVALAPFDIYWLGVLCERCVERPGHAPDFSRPSFVCGGARFFSLTIGAAQWLDDYAAKWWSRESFGWLDPDADMDLLATAYAMAHSYDPAKLHELTDHTHARLVIRTWASRLTCTERQLVQCIKSWMGDGDTLRVDNPNERKPADPAPDDWGGTLCWLAYHYKQEPRWFLWNCTDDELSLMIRRAPVGEHKADAGRDEDFEALRVLKKYLTELRGVTSG